MRSQLAFLKSEFGGQLPQPFAHHNGTVVVPPHMNDMNREEPTRYVGLQASKSSACLLVMHGCNRCGCKTARWLWIGSPRTRQPSNPTWLSKAGRYVCHRCQQLSSSITSWPVGGGLHPLPGYQPVQRLGAGAGSPTRLPSLLQDQFRSLLRAHSTQG